MKQSVSSGTIYFMGSEIAFMLSNYLIHIGLARYLGREAYGVFGILMSLYLINRSVLNTGLPRAVSKFLSESPEKIGSIFKSSFKIQVVIAVSFALFYILFAPLIANILHDQSLVNYIIFIGVMVTPMALFSLHTNGYLNGLRMFRQQAYVSTVYPIVRLGFTILLVWLGWALWGALVGYFMAIIFGLLWCRYLLRRFNTKADKTTEDQAYPAKKIISFAVPIVIASLAFTLLRNVNILFIKSILGDNNLVGLYTAAATLSTITYIAFTGLPLTLTPSVSGAIASQDWHHVRKYISKSIRYLLLLLLPITALMAATSKELLVFFYSAEYAPAAAVLSLLVIASAFLSIFSVFGSIVTGSGRPRMEMYWCVGLVLALALLNILLIPVYGMIGSAWASVITSVIAAVIAGGYVYWKFKAFTAVSSVLRISGVSVFIFILARHWPPSGIALALPYITLTLLYGILLYLFGELKKSDFLLVRNLLPGERNK